MRTGKLFRFLIVALFFVGFSGKASAAYVKWVIDPYAIKAVTINTAAVKKVENEHNERLDSIKRKQEAIAKYTSTMMTIKELYRMSMQNIRGFGEESVYYKTMALEFGKIPGNLAKALKAINQTPGINYINSLKEINDIQMEAISCVNIFVNVVNNGKVDVSAFTSKKDGDKVSEFFKNAKIGKQGDGYNFIDRYARLALCNTVIGSLKYINSKLQTIIYVCNNCNTMEHLLFVIDPDSWIKIMTGKSIANSVISDWNYHAGKY